MTAEEMDNLNNMKNYEIAIKCINSYNISETTYNTIIKFIQDLDEHYISPPSIYPARDNSVYFDWNEPYQEILVNIKDEKIIYAYHKSNPLANLIIKIIHPEENQETVNSLQEIFAFMCLGIVSALLIYSVVHASIK